jgi:hypothetical protein
MMSGKRQTRKGITAEKAMIAANKFALFHYPTMFTGGAPHRLSLAGGEVWIVPVVLTHPDHGVVGQVGSIIIDAGTGDVLGHTPRSDVVAVGKRIREAKGYALETAFLSARTV